MLKTWENDPSVAEPLTGFRMSATSAVMLGVREGEVRSWVIMPGEMSVARMGRLGYFLASSKVRDPVPEPRL